MKQGLLCVAVCLLLACAATGCGVFAPAGGESKPEPVDTSSWSYAEGMTIGEFTENYNQRLPQGEEPLLFLGSYPEWVSSDFSRDDTREYLKRYVNFNEDWVVDHYTMTLYLERMPEDTHPMLEDVDSMFRTYLQPGHAAALEAFGVEADLEALYEAEWTPYGDNAYGLERIVKTRALWVTQCVIWKSDEETGELMLDENDEPYLWALAVRITFWDENVYREIEPVEDSMEQEL